MSGARVILVEARPSRPDTGATVTVRLAGGGAKRRYHYGGEHWRAGIVGLPQTVASLEFDGAELGGGGVPQAMELRWAPAGSARLAQLSGLYWPDAPVTVRIGTEGDALPPIDTAGTVLDASVAGGALAIALADPAASLKKAVIVDRFGGGGDLDGPPELAGRAKGRAWGRVFNRRGFLLDPANAIWCFGDPARRWQAIDQVRDMGVAASAEALTSLAWQGSAEATFAALRDAEPVDGGGVLCPDIACVKWWTSEPGGDLHADIRGEIAGGYAETAAEIAARIVAARSALTFVAGTVAAAAAARPAPFGWAVDDETTMIAATLSEMLRDVSTSWLLSADGAIELRPWAWSAPVVAARSIGVERRKVHAPVATRKLGYRRNMSPMARGDLAAIVLARDVSFDDGSTAADLIDPSNLLGVEKATSFAETDTSLANRHTALTDAAAPYIASNPGIAAAVTAAGAARTAYLAWRNALDPAWDNTDEPTTIDRAAYNARVAAWSGALDTLQQLIASGVPATGNVGGVREADGSITGGAPAEDIAQLPGRVDTAEDRINDLFGTWDTGQDIIDAAAEHEANAQLARDQAQAARDVANNSRDTAIAQALAAAGSATAAAGAASVSTTKADEASGYAASALADAAIATTKAGEANASATLAATSKDDAAGSAASALASQTLTASTYKSTVLVGGNQHFDDGLTGWGHYEFSSVAGQWDVVASQDGRSNVVRSKANARCYLYSDKFYPIDPERVYEMRASAWTGPGTGGSLNYFGYQCWDDAGPIGENAGHAYWLFPTQPAGAGWVDRVSGPITGASFWPGTTRIRLLSFQNYDENPTIQTAVDYLTIEDVTARAAAADHAAAAALSESSAAASESGASMQAAAATASAVTASTKAGEASVSAGAAATSASDALGSANTASASQALAASSEAAAKASLAAMFPRVLSIDALTFAYYGLAAASLSPADSPATGVVSVGSGSAYSFGLFFLATVPFVSAQAWQVRATLSHDAGPTTAHACAWVTYLNAGGSYLGGDTFGAVPAYSNGGGVRSDHSWETAPTVGSVPAGTAFLRFGVLLNRTSGLAPNDGTVLTSVYALTLDDVSGARQAQASAAAAAVSASTASTKAGEAGASATAANSSKLDAQAANTGAQTAASAAAGSAATATSEAATATGKAVLSSAYSATRGLTPNGLFDVDALWVPTNMAYGTWYKGKGYRAEASVTGTLRSGRRLPVDPNRAYRLNFNFVVHGTGALARMYGGLRCYDAAGTLLGDVYMTSLSAKVSNGAVYYKSDQFTGTLAPGGSAPWYTYGDGFLPGTAFVEELAFANYADPVAIAYATEIFGLYLEDVTSERAASTQAGIATSQATIATAQAAAAQQSAIVSASINAASINPNAIFADYPSGAVGVLPASWSSGGGSYNIYRVAGENGVGYAARLPGIAGSDSYIYSSSPHGSIRAGDWYVVECDWRLNAGTHAGAGVFVYIMDGSDGSAGSYSYPFATAVGAGTVGQTYRRRWLVQITPATVSRCAVMAMSHYSGYGSTAAANDITFYRCAIRAATDQEIAAKQASADISTLSATVSTQAIAIADVQGKTAARWEVIAVAGGRARLTVHADANGGGGVDIEGDLRLIGDMITSGVIKNAANNVRWDVPTGLQTIVVGSYRKVTGAAFGTNSDLMEWWGLNSVTAGAETKANSIFALATDGKLYYGGADLHGQLGGGGSKNFLAVSGNVTATSLTLASSGNIAIAGGSLILSGSIYFGSDSPGGGEYKIDLVTSAGTTTIATSTFNPDVTLDLASLGTIATGVSTPQVCALNVYLKRVGGYGSASASGNIIY